LLTTVGVDLIHLGQLLLLLLLLELGLLLFVFLQALLALITSQLAVVCSLRYSLSLGSTALTLGVDCVSLDSTASVV